MRAVFCTLEMLSPHEVGGKPSLTNAGRGDAVQEGGGDAVAPLVLLHNQHYFFPNMKGLDRNKPQGVQTTQMGSVDPHFMMSTCVALLR